IDYVLELFQQYGDKAQNAVNLPKGWGIDELEFASVRSKYSEFVRLMKLSEAGNSGVLKLAEHQKYNIHDIIKMLNLPGDINGELHPLVKVFLSIHAEGVESLS